MTIRPLLGEALRVAASAHTTVPAGLPPPHSREPEPVPPGKTCRQASGQMPGVRPVPVPQHTVLPVMPVTGRDRQPSHRARPPHPPLPVPTRPQPLRNARLPDAFFPPSRPPHPPLPVPTRPQPLPNARLPDASSAARYPPPRPRIAELRRSTQTPATAALPSHAHRQTTARRQHLRPWHKTLIPAGHSFQPLPLPLCAQTTRG